MQRRSRTSQPAGFQRRQWALFTAVVGAVTIGGFQGCLQFDDTVNYIPLAGSSVTGGGMGGGMGQGGMGELDARQYFEQFVKPGMVVECAKGDCHGSGTLTFLQIENEYSSITTYTTKEIAPGTPLIVMNAASSLLLTYPPSDEHTGTSWEDGLQELRDHARTWLEMEALNVEPPDDLILGPFNPEGFVSISLASLGPGLEDFTLSFYGKTLGTPATAINVTDLRVYSPNGRGIRVTNPTIIVRPPLASDVVTTGLHGDPYVLTSPDDDVIGSVVITEYEPTSEMLIEFAALAPLYADEDGNTFDPCTRVDLFRDGVEALPLQSAANASNGLLYCAQQCHGGDAGSPATNTMSLVELLQEPYDYELACAKTRLFITPTLVDESPIIAVTKPPPAGHPFVFGGNTNAWGKFRLEMTDWINAEGAQIGNE